MNDVATKVMERHMIRLNVLGGFALSLLDVRLDVRMLAPLSATEEEIEQTARDVFRALYEGAAPRPTEKP